MSYFNDYALEASTNVKNFIENEGQLPNYVTISEKKYSMQQYMYISSKFIAAESIAGTKATTTDFKEVKVDTPKITPIKADIDKVTYYDMNVRVTNFFDNNNKAPSFVSSKYGNVQFQAHIYSNAKILNYYRVNNVMPNYVSLNLAENNRILTYLPKYVIVPEDPKLYSGVGIKSLKSDNGETKLELFIISSNTTNHEKELNNVSNIVVEIEGYNSMTFKRPVEGWKLDENFEIYEYKATFSIYFTIKDQPESLDNKRYSVKLYDKENKLLFSDSNFLSSKY
jgi:hypothetical protein